MGYVDKIRKALDEFEAAQGDIDSERRDIEAQRRECLITDRVAGEKLAALSNRASESLSEARRAIQTAREEYLSGLRSRYLVSADKVDANDLAMLGNPMIQLGASDLEALAEKHSSNMVMLGAISACADQRGICIDTPYFSEEARAAEAVGFADGAYDACRELAAGRGGLKLAAYQTCAAPASLAGE